MPCDSSLESTGSPTGRSQITRCEKCGWWLLRVDDRVEHGNGGFNELLDVMERVGRELEPDEEGIGLVGFAGTARQAYSEELAQLPARVEKSADERPCCGGSGLRADELGLAADDPAREQLDDARCHTCGGVL